MRHFITTGIFIIGFALVLNAQSPGGVTGAGSNEIWFDASQLTLSNNDRVSSWTDMSGSGNHATGSGTSRPTFKTTRFNGLPAVKFDGTDDRLRTGPITALNTNTLSSFVVFSSADAATGVLFRSAYTGGACCPIGKSVYMYGQYYEPSSNNLNFITKNADGTNRFITDNPYTGTLSITSQVWDASTSFSAYRNGSLVSSIAGGTANPTGNLGLSLGGNYQHNGLFMKVFMAEKITYSSALSSAEINIIENYLGAKYAIAIGNDLYAYDGTSGYELIGIGQEADGNNLSALGTSPLGMSVGSLSNGDYILAGHDNAGYASNTTDLPILGGARFNQVWRSDVAGAPGLVTVTMDVTEYALGQDTAYKLLVDADGIFAAGATSYNGVYAAGTVTFSNVSLASGDYFTLANSTISILSTGVTTDWHTTTTWNCLCIPQAGMTVTIQGGHTVDINGQNAAVGDITINGTLTFSATDTLRVINNLTNTNVFTSGTGAVLLNGSVVQTLTGTLALHDLIIDNTAGVTNTGAMSIAGGGFLDVVDGSLATGNDLTFMSSLNNTGALANPTTGSITGDITVQRYLYERWSGGSFGNSWFLLGAAVSGADLEDWNQEFEMQGFLGTEWFPATSSVYYYDQNNNVASFDDGYTVPGNTTDIMPNERGYEIWVGDDGYATGGRTIDITGTAVLGSTPISAPHIVKIGVPADDGWTLMANPYASPVLWSNVSKTGAYDNAYRRKWDASSVVIASSYVLGVGEAFWVHADLGGATITFDPSDVNTTNVDKYNSRTVEPSSNPILSIKLDYGENQYDETVLGFSENAIDARERGTDAYKLRTAVPTNPNISTMVDNSDFCRNIMNMNTESIVPVRIYTHTPSEILKDYTLIIENVKDILEQNKKLVLEDRDLNTFTELTEDLSLPIQIMDDVSEPRFFLHIKSPLTIVYENVTCKADNNGSITVNSDEIGVLSYAWKDENDIIIKQSSNANGVDKIENLKAGAYTIEVNGKNSELIISTIEITEPSKTTSVFEMYSSNFNDEVLTQGKTLQVEVGEEVIFNNLSIGNTSLLWEFGDLGVSSERNARHIYFNEGLYTVSLKTKNGSCEVVSTQVLRVLPNNNYESNLLDNMNVIVVENGILVSLNNEDSKDVSFSIVNSLGQEVFSKDINAEINHQERIKLDNAQGVYLITVKDSRDTKTKKFVLSKK